MKKIVFSLIAATMLVHAQKLPYKVFLETFENSKDSQATEVLEKVKSELSDYNDINIRLRPSNQYKVIVVETIMEEDRFNELYSKIKKMPNHTDAFWLPAPELTKGDFNENYTKNEPIQEEVAPVAPAEIEEEVTTIDEIAPASQIVTLDETIDTVLTTNPNIQERIYNYMEVGKELDIADKGYYPTLDFTGSITLGKDKASEGSKNRENEKRHNNHTKQAELRFVQNLYNGGSTENNIIQAKHRMTNASYLVLERADRIILNTTSAYLDVIKEKKLLDLAAQNIKTHEDIYQQIKERTTSGFGRSSEEQQAGSRLSLAQSNFIAQQNAYDDALSTFTKLTKMTISGNELQYPEFLVSLPDDIKTIEEKAMQCNPSVRAELANVDFTKNIYKDADAAFLPKLDFEAFGSIRDTDNYSYDGQRIDSYGVLLRLRYNLFNKGIDSATKEKRQIAVQKEQQVLDSIKQDLSESLRFSWQSYILTSKKLEYLQNHLDFSQETLNSYKEEFKIGRRDLINVLDAENEYYNARKEMTTAQKDLVYAKYRILDNMGLLTDSFKAGFGKKYIKDACSIEENLQ